VVIEHIHVHHAAHFGLHQHLTALVPSMTEVHRVLVRLPMVDDDIRSRDEER
jgi:hypothetical protein